MMMMMTTMISVVWSELVKVVTSAEGLHWENHQLRSILEHRTGIGVPRTSKVSKRLGFSSTEGDARWCKHIICNLNMNEWWTVDWMQDKNCMFDVAELMGRYFFPWNWWVDIFHLNMLTWGRKRLNHSAGYETLSWVKLYDDQTMTNSLGHSGTDDFTQHFRY